jgi:hypothetical protein
MDLPIARDTLSRKHFVHTLFSFPSRSSEEFPTRKPWVVIGISCGIVHSRGYDEQWGIGLIIVVRELINSYIYMSPDYRIVTLVPLCRSRISLYHNFQHPNYHKGDICGLSGNTGRAKSSYKPTLVRSTGQCWASRPIHSTSYTNKKDNTSKCFLPIIGIGLRRLKQGWTRNHQAYHHNVKFCVTMFYVLNWFKDTHHHLFARAWM